VTRPLSAPVRTTFCPVNSGVLASTIQAASQLATKRIVLLGPNTGPPLISAPNDEDDMSIIRIGNVAARIKQMERGLLTRILESKYRKRKDALLR